jgi:hypothetical protein
LLREEENSYRWTGFVYSHSQHSTTHISTVPLTWLSRQWYSAHVPAWPWIEMQTWKFLL